MEDPDTGYEISEFHLVEDSDGDTWWHEYAPHPHDGKMAYLNFAGAGFHPSGKEKVLRRVTACRFRELDWKGTAMDQPGSDAGWLDRAGRFHGCYSFGHDMYARYMLKREVADLENTGWVRVYGLKNKELPWSLGFRDGLRLSAEQRMWLDRNGHTVEDYH